MKEKPDKRGVCCKRFCSVTASPLLSFRIIFDKRFTWIRTFSSDPSLLTNATGSRRSFFIIHMFVFPLPSHTLAGKRNSLQPGTFVSFVEMAWLPKTNSEGLGPDQSALMVAQGYHCRWLNVCQSTSTIIVQCVSYAFTRRQLCSCNCYTRGNDNRFLLEEQNVFPYCLYDKNMRY